MKTGHMLTTKESAVATLWSLPDDEHGNFVAFLTKFDGVDLWLWAIRKSGEACVAKNIKFLLASYGSGRPGNVADVQAAAATAR